MRLKLLIHIIIGILLIVGCSTEDKKGVNNDRSSSVKPMVLKAGVYEAINDSSKILWECEWLGGARHDGDVQLVSGFVDISETSNVSGKFIVNLNSMSCYDLKNKFTNQKLISHLKSDDFFNVENYPEAVLDLLSSHNIAGNEYKFMGNLTIKGRTHSIIFTGTVKEEKLSYETNLKLIFDRSKYDVRYRSASLFSDLGDRIIADDVKLTVKAKFKRDSKI